MWHRYDIETQMRKGPGKDQVDNQRREEIIRVIIQKVVQETNKRHTSGRFSDAATG